MATVGNVITPSNISVDLFNGDGTTTLFTLVNGAILSSDNAYDVYVDGVLQELGTQVTRATDEFTFTLAPPTGTNNIIIKTVGAALDINQPADASVNALQLATDAVTTLKILNANVTAAKLANAIAPRILLADSGEISAAATQDFDDVFSSAYEVYEIVVERLQPANDGTETTLIRFGDGAVYDSGASDYSWGIDSGAAGDSDTADSEIQIHGDTFLCGGAAGEEGYWTMRVHNPESATNETRIYGNGMYHNGVGTINPSIFGARFNSAVEQKSIQFLYTAGNIAQGRIRIYGLTDGSL